MSTDTAASSPAPVLILGGGVNGASVARELTLNGVPVVVVDSHDVGGGASAKSSRLIHGGLRYLEYGEFSLVRESLAERRRLLELAPHLVHPLRLHIPIRRRRGGILQAGVRFLGLGKVASLQRLMALLQLPAERGLWAARIGLTLYDAIAGKGSLPGHEVAPLPSKGIPPLDPAEYRWVCSYWDAQMVAPERFVVALLRDAQAAARHTGVSCEILTRRQVQLHGDGVELSSNSPESPEPRAFRPSLIVNATGAWGDATLESLPVEAPRMFGGTRGSHIITRHAGLRSAIGADAVYAEAADGRLVFILPWRDAVLVGTTDERFSGDPEEAVATEAEITYLVKMVRYVFPNVGFGTGDVACHYSGVRPLPYVPEGKTGAITRDHAIDSRVTRNGIPIDTLIGGKLTTCRAFGELAADHVLEQLGRTRTANTRSRLVPGGMDFPPTADAVQQRLADIAAEFQIERESAAAVWDLLGTETEVVLRESLGSANSSGAARENSRRPVIGTRLPCGVVDWIIRQEWVAGVADLVERRLLLVFAGECRRETLRELEQRIISVRGSCAAGADDAAERLRLHYGIDVDYESPFPDR